MKEHRFAKRLLPATGIALAVAVVLGGTMGVAMAGQAENAKSVDVPYARIGDRASYTLTLQGEWLYQDKKAGQPFEFLTFEWRNATEIMDAEGRKRTVDPVALSGLSYTPHSIELDQDGLRQGEAWQESAYDAHFEPLQPRLVAVGLAWEETEEHAALDVMGVKFLQSKAESKGRILSYPEEATLCLVGESVQGRRLTVGDSVELGTCFLPNLLHVRLPATATVEASGPVNGLDAVAVRAGNATLWFASGIPYPVRMLAKTETALSYEGEHGAGTFQVDLVGLDVGDQPRVAGKEPGPAPKALATAARAAWGMDETGIAHPFPPSLAFQKAQELEPKIAEFVRKNPDAYVNILLGGGVLHHGHTDKTSWLLQVTNGDYALAVWMTQETPQPGRLLGLGPVVPNALAKYEHTLLGEGEVRAPSPASLPEEWPTVKATLERWQHYSGYETQEHDWGHIVYCAGDCENPTVMLMAGHTNIELYYAKLTPPSLMGIQLQGSSLAMAMSGRAYSYYDTSLEMQSSPPMAPATTAPRSSPVASATALRMGFLATPEATAGAGLLAILSGLVYWLWPALKSGGVVGLFSRVQGSRLLDHPQRSRLVDLVNAEPGIHFQELQRRTAIANGTLVHHLRKLESGGHVVAHKSGRYTCYFPRAASPESRMAAGVTKADGAKAVLSTIQANPGLTMQDVAARCGLQPSTVTYHVQRLHSAGLVSMERDGKFQRLQARAAA